MNRPHRLGNAVCALALGALLAGRARADAASDSLSVEECAALARRAAPEPRVAAEEKAAASLDSLAVARNRHPAFSLFGDALVAPRGSYDPVITNLGQYDFKAGIEFPLWDGGGRRRERERGALAAQAAALTLELAGRDAATRAGVVALDRVRLRESERAEDESFEWLERLRTLVDAGVRAGTRGSADAVRVALERDAVAASLSETRQQSDERQRELGVLIGRAGGPVPEVREPAPAADRAPEARDSLALLDALTRAAEVREARVVAERQRLALEEARRRNAIHVGLAADAGLSGSDLTTLVPADLRVTQPGATFRDRLNRDLGASVALNFKLPLADPTRAPGVDARAAELRAAELRLGAAEDEQRRGGLDLVARWRVSAQRLAAADSSAHRAADHLLRLRSLYAAGATSLLELLDARRLLDDARERVSTARFELRAARLEAELRR